MNPAGFGIKGGLVLHSVVLKPFIRKGACSVGKASITFDHKDNILAAKTPQGAKTCRGTWNFPNLFQCYYAVNNPVLKVTYWLLLTGKLLSPGNYAFLWSNAVRLQKMTMHVVIHYALKICWIKCGIHFDHQMRYSNCRSPLAVGEYGM